MESVQEYVNGAIRTLAEVNSILPPPPPSVMSVLVSTAQISATLALVAAMERQTQVLIGIHNARAEEEYDVIAQTPFLADDYGQQIEQPS
jgi:hypothetical protein